MSEALLITPLYDRQAPSGLAIQMSEVVDRGMIDLRGLPKDKKFMDAAKSALGVALPTTPRTTASKGDVVCLWMSLDQWLITCPRKDVAALLAKLNKALEGIHSLAVDMSDARAIIRLEGDRVRETLMKGSSIDFTQSGYEAGTVRRMLFGEIAAMVHVVSDSPDVFELMVFRSYAHHAWDWVEATAMKGSEVDFLKPAEAPAVV